MLAWSVSFLISSNQTRKIKFGKSAYSLLDQPILEFIEDRRKERITITEKKSEGKLQYYLKNSIPMFNMNLEPQEAGLEECAAEII